MSRAARQRATSCNHGFGALAPTAGAGTVTPADVVVAETGLGAREPDGISTAFTVSTMAVRTRAPAASAPMVMRTLRLSTQNRRPHLWQRYGDRKRWDSPSEW